MNTPESSNEPLWDGPEDPTGDQGDGTAPDDVMLDLLLHESLGGAQPPDQAAVILRRLADHVEQTSRATQPSAGGKRNSSTSRLVGMLGIAAGLLLCGGIAIGLRYRAKVLVQAKANDVTESSSSTKQAAEGQPVDMQTANVAADPKRSTGPAATTRKTLPQPIELAGGPPSNSSTVDDRDGTKPAGEMADKKRSARGDSQPITLVSKNLNQRWRLHWKRLGVTPTESRDAKQIQSDLSARLGLQIPLEAIGDPDATWTALRSDANRNALAKEILAAWTGHSRRGEANEIESVMLGQLTSKLKSGPGMDRLIQSWLTSTNTEPKSGAEDETVPAGVNAWVRLLQPANVHEIVTQTASLTQHRDLRCQRCHDVPGGGDEIPTQADYWQFTSMVSAWVKPSQANRSLYYDTLDGRRRLAKSVSDDETRQWVNDLGGSRDLARGIAASLFAMVHETPRHAGPFDLSDATPTPAPQEMIDALADDLVANDFDVLRCVSVLLTDSVMDRSVPDAMTPGGILMANDQQWTDAVLSVHAMAARSPFRRPESMQRRLQLAQTELEPNWSQTDGRDALLAQPLGSGPQSNGQSNGSGDSGVTLKKPDVATTGYPLRSSMVVPAWIGKLPDSDSRLDHVAHLAGKLSLSQAQRELAQRSLAADNNEALILERLWWIIRPES